MNLTKSRKGVSLAVLLASALAAGNAMAVDAIDTAAAEAAITTGKAAVTTLGSGAIAIAVLFLSIKLIRRGISKV